MPEQERPLAPPTEAYFAALEQLELTPEAELALASLRGIFAAQEQRIAVDTIVIKAQAENLGEVGEELAETKEELAETKEDLAESERRNRISILTGLPNQQGLEHDIKRWSHTSPIPDVEHEHRSTPETPHNRLIILTDLDSFKIVNDVLGFYKTGNPTIQLAGQLFEEVVRDMDTVYHLSGDEFAISAKVTVGQEQAAFNAITQRFRDTLGALQRLALELLGPRSSEGVEISDTSAWQLAANTAEAIRVIDATFAMGILRPGDTEEEMLATMRKTMDELKRKKDESGHGMR
jgi:diguanylate cyclase (GGDEF)-like protein